MSSREIVLDLLNRLPPDATLGEIAREIEFLAGVELARQQARRGEGLPVEEIRTRIDQWAAQSS